MTACLFLTLSKHSTSLGWVRYQRCACGRLRVLLAGDVLKDGAAPPRGPSPEEPVTAAGRAAGGGEPAC
ncbi:hypothetical protein PV963_41940 [Streptomyces coeruleorubidus]|uniref:hypothetical protein n=1 Tax=Streptomyces coeruleorubidus TaxID=116188 RepID=UPI00237EFF55|nr:hypothetical protein [Streptomyces coeruleorubidus]WDV56438.1 hypothetical protein PV963_41940 [Streptomyces coeruleorubidus]